MGFFSQLGQLLWKNWHLHKRRPCSLVFEIILPIFFACIVLALRVFIKPTPVDTDTYYSSENLHPPLFPSVTIGYVPNYVNTQSIMNKVTASLNSMPGTNVTALGFQSEAELVSYYSNNRDALRMGVVFQGLSNSASLPTSVSFKLRPATNSSQKWRTKSTYEFYQTIAPRQISNGPDYWSTGVVYIQTLVGEAIISTWQGSTFTANLKAQRMPYPPYSDDGMVFVIQTQLPLFIMLSFILSVIQTTKSVVMEKERGIKESMKLMGLKPAAHWTSWFLTAFILLFISMAIYAILFGVKISAKTGSVLANSNIFLFYIFLLCYACALITFCFMISAFVQKANVGAALSGILFFGFYMPYLFLQSRYSGMSLGEKIAVSLLFNMAMCLGANNIGLYEGTGKGAQWNNFYEPATVDDNYSLMIAMLMLLLDSAIHLLITWYMDNVRPGEYGVPKPFYFCFTKTYWCGSGNVSKDPYETPQADDRNFEREPPNLQAGVHICNLTKEFGKGKVAVARTNLKLFQDQITVLLGHNGAGKTTTMSMLTGFIPPTSGTAIVNGHDIRTDIDGVRKSLGLCPQHNILYDALTVEEHLKFFARLKGSPASTVQTEVDQMITDVGLAAKKKTQSQKLSGGQKRKLSVGIALIANSKVVILDEPSSGMDPAARRQTWELLQRHRAGRTLLLTTHYMDEADVLGDRIAIMDKGVVKCCGSSMFLKKLFGAGYHLVIVKEAKCNVDQLTKMIQSKIENAVLESEINCEVSYLLPDYQSASFPGLFRSLEDSKDKLGITGFGTSATTMEEVFLKVGERAEEETAKPNSPTTPNGFSNSAYVGDKEEKQLGGDDKDDIMSFNKHFKKLDGLPLERSRFKGMFMKKVILSWRHRVITIVQVILPVLFTIFALLIDTTSRNEEQTLNFDLSPFSSTFVAYSNGSSPSINTENAAMAYANQFKGAHTTYKVDLAAYNSNMSQYLVTKAKDIGISTYNQKVIVGAQFDQPSVSALAYYNGQPYHALPISVSLLLNGLARNVIGSSYSIASSMEPLPMDQDSEAKTASSTSSLQGFLVGFCICFGMAFLTSSFIYFLVKEREVGSKHLQVVSGVGPKIFWLATLTWDYLNYLIVCFATLIVFAAFQTAAYVNDHRLGLVLLVLLLYGLAALPFVYMVHFLFKSPATSMVVLIIFNIFTGLVTTVAVYVLYLPTLGIEKEADIFNWVFLVLFPNYCMARSFMDIYTNYLNLDTCNKLNYKLTCLIKNGPCCKSFNKCSSYCLNFDENYFAWATPGVGKFLLFMVLHGILFMAVTLAIEYNLFNKMTSCIKNTRKSRPSAVAALASINGRHIGVEIVDEDSDVVQERERINMTSVEKLSETDTLILKNLCKKYGNFTAVDHINLGVPEQECFGLLGQNGAGKTTTFKMLTGDVTVTSGNASLKSYDIVQHIKKVQQNMGYCPQFDALLEQMTGRETLTMYARLRGVPEDNIKAVVNKLIEILLLQPHADKLAGQYSGGNKRKLSTAIALVGNPSFILLDEPSSGVDPAARRQLWNVLSKVRASGKTLVLTSHSMEECDALCTRIAIMVNGQFKCLGSPQHLKNKFGQGYTLIVKIGSDCSESDDSNEPVKKLVLEKFKGATVFDAMHGYVHFQVPDATVHVADVFSVMEAAKSEKLLEDYSVHQTTLEQVFLTFTRKQIPPKEDGKKSIMAKICPCCYRSVASIQDD